MLWVENGLIKILIRTNVAEVRAEKNSLTFTKSFHKFVMKNLHGDAAVLTPQECQKILCQYHRALATITFDQVLATMVIFGFYFDQIELPVPDGR
jgi:hypothetical protein